MDFRKYLFLFLVILVFVGGCSYRQDYINDLPARTLELPTEENPIIIDPKNIILTDREDITLGFYNKMDKEASNATLEITGCFDQSQKAIEPVKIITISQTIGPKQAVGYRAIIQNVGLAPGNYLCNLAVVNREDPSEIYEEEEIFITVVAE